jgi:DNA-binding CsgD family transcriptional regulator
MRVSELPLVGRSGELAALLDAQRAAAGGARVCLVTGDAGLGKSRLVAALRAATPDVDVLIGRCLDYARAPYAPLTQIAHALHARDGWVLARRPDLREGFGELFGVERHAPRDDDGVGKRLAFDAAIEAFGLYAARRGFTVVVEDAHWSDLGTLELLYHLALAGSALPVLIVLTAREDELDALQSRWLTRFERLPEVERIALRSLSAADADALLDHELRLLGRTVAPRERRAIRADAGGNPLFLRELTRHRAAGGDAADLPASIAGAVRARLRTLPAAQQQIVRAASALVDFDEALLGAIVAAPPDEVATALRGAIDGGLIVRTPGGAHLAFEHELTRGAVYADVLPTERQRWHAAMVAHLDAHPTLDADGSRRALHAWAAGDHAAAAHWNERAGDVAAERYAFADAAASYERALLAARDRPARLVDKHAFALERSGRPAAALPLLDELLAGETTHARERAALLLRIASAQVRATRDDVAVEATDRARAVLAGDAPSPEHFAALVFRAWLAARAHDAETTFALLAQAEPYRDLGAYQAIMRSHEAAAIAHAQRRELGPWRTRYDAMVETARTAEDLEREIGAIANFANSAFGLGETALAIELTERAVATAERGRRLELVPYVIATAAWTMAYVGDLARARTLVEASLPYCGDFPASELISNAVGVVVAARTDDPDLLARCFRPALFERALETGEGWQLVQAVPALTEGYLAQGDRARAREVVRRALAPLRSAREMAGIVVLVGEYGLGDAVPEAMAWLEAEAARQPHAAGFVALHRALVARSETDRRVSARAAADAFAQVGYRLHEARAHELAGDRDAARALYTQCGATRDVARLDDRTAPAPRPPNGLTRRETQVAALAATGLSNREIGERLTLSDRTVEHHLGAVFAKLGVRSRVELAARHAASGGGE